MGNQRRAGADIRVYSHLQDGHSRKAYGPGLYMPLRAFGGRKGVAYDRISPSCLIHGRLQAIPLRETIYDTDRMI